MQSLGAPLQSVGSAAILVPLQTLVKHLAIILYACLYIRDAYRRNVMIPGSDVWEKIDKPWLNFKATVFADRRMIDQQKIHVTKLKSLTEYTSTYAYGFLPA